MAFLHREQIADQPRFPSQFVVYVKTTPPEPQPVAMPSCRSPGIMRLRVSGSHDWKSRREYTTATGAMNQGVRTMR